MCAVEMDIVKAKELAKDRENVSVQPVTKVTFVIFVQMDTSWPNLKIRILTNIPKKSPVQLVMFHVKMAVQLLVPIIVELAAKDILTTRTMAVWTSTSVLGKSTFVGRELFV